MAQTKRIRLFHIEKDINDNIVCYDLSLKNGNPDKDKPIISYWANLVTPWHDDLTLFDKIVYGHSIHKSKNPKEFSFTLRAYDKRVLRVLNHNSKWIAVTKINGSDAQIIKFYVKMKGTMTAEYLDIYGKDLATGKIVRERLKGKTVEM